MKRSEQSGRARRLPFFHVVLAHALVLLQLLTPCTQAGDILRMGGGGGAAAPTPGSSGSPTDAAAVNAAAATAQARHNAQDMLARNTLALQAVEAMQAAARAAAAGANNAGVNPNFPGQTLPDVPNGLGTGGLDYISGTGAGTPTSATGTDSQNNIRTIVTIQQQQQQALLEWRTFNVGRETTVKFDQSAGGESAGNWIAFNRVTDPTGNPTQILGSIEAQGQVYIINQNGIIFGGASEVNTHALVASALPINDNLITRGLLNNPDSQFLFSANPQAAGSKGPTPAYTPPAPPASGRIGNVTVQAGARITAPTSSANVGGRVALIGPNVTNEGTISTPDGQTILAAGMEVGFDAHSTDDPSLRGLDVYVGDVGAYGGTATNAGLIEAPRGSIVITGKNVNQNGFLNSTTSVALNGRIDLLANYNAMPNTNYDPSDASLGKSFLYRSGVSTGIVSTGAGSVMQILPEWGSTTKVVGTQLALKSQVFMQGLAVYLGADSVILAPNADVAISAGIWDTIMVPGITDEDFVAASGQVYLDHGAVVNVAGSTAIASSLDEYILTVTLRAAELADSALQRNGSLRGQTITVDLREPGVREDGTEWVGTPLADLTGYLGVIERNVGQLTVAGGTVSISAGGSVVMQDGATLDVSGGYLDYGGGYVQTSRLLHQGNLVDIADARADILYDGIYTPTSSSTDPRWGTSTSATSQFGAAGHLEDAHSVGANGGKIDISAAAMALDGSLKGNTIVGPQQLEAAPQAASLALHFRAQQTLRTPLVLPYYSPTPPDIEFRGGLSGLPAADAFSVDGSGTPAALRAERQNKVVLSPTLLGSQGFGSLVVDNKDGNITVPAGVVITTPATGSITLLGANVDVQGSVIAPAGTITLEAYNVSPYTTAMLEGEGSSAIVPPVDPTRGRVTVGAAAVLRTNGLVIDDRADSATRTMVPHEYKQVQANGTTQFISTTEGGSISINGFTAELSAGSVLDVGGGLILDQTGSIIYSDAGSVSLKAGRDPLLTSLVGGHLTLAGVINGLSGASGGSLTLQAPVIQVGGTAIHADALVLDSEFFNTGGFDSFHLIGFGINATPPGGAETFLPGVLITAGAQIRPQVRSLQAAIDPQGGAITWNTFLQPEGYRPTASLVFEAPGFSDFSSGQLSVRGGILAEAGSFIETDALGSVVFTAQTVELLGSVVAPGGSIKVNGALRYPENNTAAHIPLVTVHLGASSLLSTAGKTVLLQDPYGRRTGHVYAGGSLLVQGNIVADAGAVLDVSGTSSVLDLLLQEAGITQVFTADLSQTSLFPGTSVTSRPLQAQTIATQVDSDGGTLTLSGGDFLFSNATLLGEAGGSKAAGGHLVVKSGRFVASGLVSYDQDINLVVAQAMANFAQPVFGPGSVIGQSLGSSLPGVGYFGVDSFASGGFDSLELGGNVEFRGAVDVAARAYLKVADGGVMAANDLVRLTAPYVALGRPLLKPIRDEEMRTPYYARESGRSETLTYFGPTYGSGDLEVNADVIDIGLFSLQNIGRASLTARQDLRGSGYFDIAGDLTLTAGQIYPVTASTFTITAYNYSVGGVATNGSITIASSGVTPQFPLSGGGRLNIFASTIIQGGTLRAPLGTIRLGWDGTGTAPKGLVTNTDVPVAQQVTLAAGSVTSVSAIDSQTGAGVRIPYGIVKDGTNWIDPTGLDITSTGAPDKSVSVTGVNVTTEAGSTVDIRGGGELYGYRWVEGNGGTNDILDTNGSFAILPGYNALFAPFAAYADIGLFVGNLGGDTGYLNSLLSVGDQIYLKAAPGLAEGAYTLLPARYALLPGAMLVTPSSSGTLTTSQVKPGGALLTNGYRFNGLNSNVSGSIFEQFEVAPLSVVKARAEYVDNLAHVFIPAAQQRLSLPGTVTSQDAGYALLTAQQSMQILGGVSAAGVAGGRGGRVDVSSRLDIVLAAPGAAAQPGKLVLDTTLLSGWNAESLLIGGERVSGNGTSSVTVRTTNLTLDNAGAPLSGTDIVLVANGSLTLAAGSSITQSGLQPAADSFVVAGNGALVRVSGIATAQTLRTGVTSSALPQLTIGAGAVVSGRSITLDSSNVTNLSPLAALSGNTVNLSSSRISVLLDTPGALQSDAGLVLGGSVLSGLLSAGSLSLLSYTSLDFYGAGAFATTGGLAFHAGEIRGFNQGAGAVNITAANLLLDNAAGGAGVGAVTGMSGVLNLTANTITIGSNALVVNQFSTVAMNAAGGLVMQGSGSFRAQGDLSAVTPFVSAISSASQTLAAAGVLTLSRPSGPQTLPTTLGLGGQVVFEGASVNAGTDVLLPSGLITLHALAGDLTVTGALYAGGVGRTFFDSVRYTDAGQVSLTADAGKVILATGSEVNVSAASGGGNAGILSVSAAAGELVLNGTVLGHAGAGGLTGSVEIDVGSLASFATLNDVLNNGAFTNERSLRIRDGDVTINGTVNAHRFLLGLDHGSITVNGLINATGQAASQLTATGGINASGASTVKTSGSISLIANGSVTLNSGAVLTVAALDFDSAGKGGSVSLESGAQRNGVVGTGSVNVQTGSTINLSVASKVAGGVATVGSSAFQGKFSGTLHIRAPQNAARTDMLVDPVNGTIVDASAIILEGYRLYDYNQANVIIRAGTVAISGETLTTTTLQNDAASFFGASNVNYNAMFSRLLASNSGLQSVAVITPGIEISNRGGNISLGTPTSVAANDWDLAGFRFGPNGAAGVLTLRAQGNLAFYNTLSDGFNVNATTASTNALEKQWTAALMAQSTLLPVNAQSWSYRMAAGADFSAANFREVRSLSSLAASAGSLLLGKNAGQAVPVSAGSNSSPGPDALTRLAINPTNGTNASTASNRFQVIRTGSGDIEIFTGRDVQLLNQFATIYTAGTAVSNAANLFGTGDFAVPQVTPSSTRTPTHVPLGVAQQNYPAQYSMAGGNVVVSAQGDIIHLTQDGSGNLIADSSRELPNNWLMRRGYIDPVTGQYGSSGVFDTATRSLTDPSTSTTWWVNFSNFFDGVAALGGGNVTLLAGHDVTNVSAHTPTNARAASGTPSEAKLLELGGGDLVVKAGRNIDGGVYYVERGLGTLYAGNTITTNATRSPSLGRLSGGLAVLDEKTWMPTALFMGQSSFDVSARGDVLLGPVANTFLLPQGINNRHWYKTYFSTYGQNSSLNVASVSGSIDFRQAATEATSATDSMPMLSAWLTTQQTLAPASAAYYQPWLRLVETSVMPFSTFTTLMPASVSATAFSGDINLVGQMNLTPSATGGLELLAGGAINALLPTGTSSTIRPGSSTAIWSSATINLSDINPASIPGRLTPFAYYTIVGNINSNAQQTAPLFLNFVNAYFKETGSTAGVNSVVQTKQSLHAPGVLHTGDTSPVRIYAAGGDVSGLTLYSAKAAQVLAQRDITDVGLYIQNVSSSDVSIVSAGRDIVAYNANSMLRSQALLPGNLPAASEAPKSGDIQISGPGSLEVLAGRDVNLGTGSNNADGTGVGITSIGNGRNPYLPFAGADIVVAAGMGGIAAGLGSSNGQFDAFINALLSEINPPAGQSAPGVFDTRRYLSDLAVLLQRNGLGALPDSVLVYDAANPTTQFEEGVVPAHPVQVGTGATPDDKIYANNINLNDPALTAEQRSQLGLALYFIALRDAGRDRNNPDSPDVNTYRAGYEAIQTLFPVPNGADGTPGIELLKDGVRPLDGYVYSGNIQTQARDIRTKSGGSISILAPGGGLEMASTLIGETLAPPGIITESGGNISIFADQDISIGIARIFTLRGGDINIWSTVGDIAAGSSSKTVQSAPPTRVLIDPQSANVATDLAGLATGGGIGVLATVAGVPPGNVDLIAPIGAVDAGDAGIRATGNLNIAAAVVLNSANIAVGGVSAGTPAAAAVASPSLGGLASAAAAGAATTAATKQAEQQKETAQTTTEEKPSIISVEVLGYGGGDGTDDDERRRNQPGE